MNWGPGIAPMLAGVQVSWAVFLVFVLVMAFGILSRHIKPSPLLNIFTRTLRKNK